jgi:hypothetical protein
VGERPGGCLSSYERLSLGLQASPTLCTHAGIGLAESNIRQSVSIALLTKTVMISSFANDEALALAHCPHNSR